MNHHFLPVLTAFAAAVALSACVSNPTQSATPDDSASTSHESTLAPATEVSDESAHERSSRSVPEVRYNVPVPTDAKGTFTVRDYGPTRIDSKKHGSALPTLRLQLVVENKADEDWTLDTRAQQIRIENGQPLRPAFARSRSGSLPFVTIAAGSKQTIDLYFVLPASARGLGETQKLAVNWQLITDEKVIDNVTTFREIARPPNAALRITEDESNKNSRESVSGASSAQGAALARPEPIVGESWWEDPFINVGEPWKDSLR